VLDYGRTRGTGSVADVLNNPAVIAAYIGTQQ
jgi:ABC-type branched-subunit amino acid transport system ATPase component